MGTMAKAFSAFVAVFFGFVGTVVILQMALSHPSSSSVSFSSSAAEAPAADAPVAGSPAVDPNAALQAQQDWFAAEQGTHAAQEAAGDAEVQNYNTQQQTEQNQINSYNASQAVNDQASQNRSDEMLDRQRLADDAGGMTYEAPAGSNYYWRNQQTGVITGTDTDTPPDYTNNYTLLRKQ